MKNLIKKHSDIFTITSENDGTFDDGLYTEGSETTKEVRLSVFPASPKSVNYREGTNWVVGDIKVYSYEELNIDDKFTFKNSDYKIFTKNNFTQHKNLYTYIARRIREDD